MKKFLLSIFFFLFILILFIWDQEQSNFWKEPSMRGSIVGELQYWNSKNPVYLETILQYKIVIICILLLAFILTLLVKRRKKKEHIIRSNPLTGGKVVLDGNNILSKTSLPESEKERTKKLKEGPALIEKNDETIPRRESEDSNEDLDAETMRRMLNSR